MRVCQVHQRLLSWITLTVCMCNDYGRNPSSQFSTSGVAALCLSLTSSQMISLFMIHFISSSSTHWRDREFCIFYVYSDILIQFVFLQGVVSLLASFDQNSCVLCPEKSITWDFCRMVIYCKSSRGTFQQDWRSSLRTLLISFTCSLFLNGIPVCHYNTRKLAGLMGNADENRWWKHSQD